MGIFDKFKKVKDQPAKSKVAEPVLATEKEKTKTKKEESVVKLEKTPERSQERKNKTKEAYGILIKPLITERATFLGQFNQYVFMVASWANKIEIAQAIETRYGVKPLRINILNNSGKKVRYGRSVGQTKDWKKAIITLPAGKAIQIQEGV